MTNRNQRQSPGDRRQVPSARRALFPWAACASLVVAFSGACGDGEEVGEPHGGGSGAPSPAAPGSASGSFNAPVEGGKANSTPEVDTAVGGAGDAPATPGAGEGGAIGEAGADSDPVSTGGSGVGGELQASGGSMPEAETRPGCELAAMIELSNLRRVESNDERVRFAIDVTNGTPMFVSYTPIKFGCAGGAVLRTQATTNFFGISPGVTREANLEVVFQPGAPTGDVVSCTVRAAIAQVSPDDCGNAATVSFELTVP